MALFRMDSDVLDGDVRREVREAREQIESETRQARDDTDREVDSVMRPLKSELERDALDDPPASTTTSTDKDRNT